MTQLAIAAPLALLPLASCKTGPAEKPKVAAPHPRPNIVFILPHGARGRGLQLSRRGRRWRCSVGGGRDGQPGAGPGPKWATRS